ncbi:MAG: flagellar motor switch protein FliN [Chloroflexi bacterium CFX7]|nr:flagellar motor switch protein FliN [Chloroflexi bacterium CFX7]MCK6564852.1 flagellar motor switch protein FliN [Dehalococcoidia bacterium]RIL02513.1 MAG: flagellar motor switch protein FliN [bacterium]
MPDPREILTQLLSPAQADSLDQGGRRIWEATATALGAILGASPSAARLDARLVMPDEITGEFGDPHLVVPVELSTDQEQTAFAYLILPTAPAAKFFDSQADDPSDEEQQTIVLASTVLGQVLQVINVQVLAGSPAGLVFSLDDITANTMATLLSTMDEPAMVLNVTIEGQQPLPIRLLVPGTFLDVTAGALPAVTDAAPAIPSLSLTEDDIALAEIVDVPPAPLPGPAPELATAGAHRSQQPRATDSDREPTPISQAPAASRARFTPLAESGATSAPHPIDLLRGLEMNVTVELGRTELTVAEVLDLGPGSIIELDRIAGEPVDILVNDRVIARGEVVVVDENFGVRVVEVLRRGASVEEDAS